ncbi:MAG: cation transporter [Chloroflexi bacterium]|nr:cation transporter [Chloroflexota bacterium]
MAEVTLKIPTLTNDEVADVVLNAVQRLKGVTKVHPDPTTHNLTVSYQEGPEGTTLTAIQVALQLARHPHAAFAAGQRRRGFI